MSILIFVIFSKALSKPILLTSIPKSGTNLVDRLISNITRLEIQRCSSLTKLDECEIAELGEQFFYEAHAPYSPNNYSLVKQKQLKVILVLRDPRAVLVSYAHWLKKGLGHQLEPNWPTLHDLPVDEVITHFITAYPTKGPEIAPYTTMAEFYDLFLGWQHYNDCYVTTFEKLVGPKGGGTAVDQENEVKAVAAFLGYTLTTDEIQAICSNLFGGTNTFRVGQIGSWKTELSQAHKAALKAMPGFNELLIKLGYEQDDTW